MKAILRMLRSLLPNSVRGKLFAVLTFLNAGLCSFFASLQQLDTAVFSAFTALCCAFVWYIELPEEDDE